jgi:hypothetical protein
MIIKIISAPLWHVRELGSDSEGSIHCLFVYRVPGKNRACMEGLIRSAASHVCTTWKVSVLQIGHGRYYHWLRSTDRAICGTGRPQIMF